MGGAKPASREGEVKGKAKESTKGSEGDAISPLGLAFMVMLALQFGVQPSLQKWGIPPGGASKAAVVAATELIKSCLCLFMLFATGEFRVALKSWTLSGSLRAAALPAGCYAMQNYLAQIAYQNLDSLSFNIINQTKTLSAALCLYAILGKRQSSLQLVALSMLAGAVTLLNAESSSSEISSHIDVKWGVVPLLGASFLSGFSGAVTQKSLQGEGRNSYLLSMELAIYGTGLLVLGSIVVGGAQPSSQFEHFLQGWTPQSFAPVINQAIGGIVVGQVTKHAGSVRKGFALIAGIIVTAVVQWGLEGQELSRAHYFAALLVALGTWIHAKYPYAKAPIASEAKKVA